MFWCYQAGCAAKIKSQLATRLLLARCPSHRSRSQPLLADPTDRVWRSQWWRRQGDITQRAMRKEGGSDHQAGCAAKIKSQLAARLLLARCPSHRSRSQPLLAGPTDRVWRSQWYGSWYDSLKSSIQLCNYATISDGGNFTAAARCTSFRRVVSRICVLHMFEFFTLRTIYCEPTGPQFLRVFSPTIPTSFQYSTLTSHVSGSPHIARGVPRLVLSQAPD